MVASGIDNVTSVLAYIHSVSYQLTEKRTTQYFHQSKYLIKCTVASMQVEYDISNLANNL